MKTKKITKNEAFDYKTIKTFEDACKKENINPNDLPDLSLIPDEFRRSIIAAYKLMVIFKAINNGWIADYTNKNYKYYPYFYVLSSGCGFVNSGCSYDFSDADSGVRLCTDTAEKALYIAKQFEAEYIDFLLYSK